ncbi:MAG: dynamin family protein [Pyrinomonadaceae bacterium]
MFTSDNFEQSRQAVIDLFARYDKNREQFKESLGHYDAIAEGDIKDLRNEVEKLKENKYLLAIVGESKAGKSMFINALLKKQILPTGVLQCTSGIIEIIDTAKQENGKKVYLKVKYANNSSEIKTIYEHESETAPIQEHLRKNAALSPDYRDLPIFLLNQCLTEDKPNEITDEYAENLLKGIRLDSIEDNPRERSKEEFLELMKKYLLEYKDLSKIPIEITVGYPLGYNFAQMRLVDTPGVNARGRVEDMTIQYVNEANAAIFIHVLKNIASTSFKEFMQTVPEKAKENLFLFLTHKSQLKEKDVEETVKEAYLLFSEIKPERIVAVDSLLKQVSSELEAGASVAQILENEDYDIAISRYERKYRDDLDKLKNVISEASNFNIIENLLQKFSERALAGQLSYVAKLIEKGYRDQHETYLQSINLLQNKITQSPAEFEKEINMIIQLLENYRQSLNEFSRKQRNNYTGVKSEVFKEGSSKLKNEFTPLVSVSTTEQMARKHFTDFYDRYKTEISYYADRLKEEYEKQMERLSIEYNSKYDISIPQISLEDIANKASENAYDEIIIKGDKKDRAKKGAFAGATLGAASGAVFGPWGVLLGGLAGAAVGAASEWLEGQGDTSEKRHNPEKYLNSYITEAVILISEVSNKMTENIGKLFELYNKDFLDKLGARIDERQRAYEELKKKKMETEELIEEIDSLKSNNETVVNQLIFTEKELKTLN